MARCAQQKRSWSGAAYGMTQSQVFYFMPQMWAYALPGLGNIWIFGIKATPLLFLLGIEDIVYWARESRQKPQNSPTIRMAITACGISCTVGVLSGLQKLSENVQSRLMRRLTAKPRSRPSARVHRAVGTLLQIMALDRWASRTALTTLGFHPVSTIHAIIREIGTYLVALLMWFLVTAGAGKHHAAFAQTSEWSFLYSAVRSFIRLFRVFFISGFEKQRCLRFARLEGALLVLFLNTAA